MSICTMTPFSPYLSVPRTMPRALYDFSAILFGVVPLTISLDDLDKVVEGLRLMDVTLHNLATAVEGDRLGRLANVAIVGIRHLTWAIHDASHNANFEILEV